MDKVKVYYDRPGNTLTVWFGDPADEDVSEQVGEEIVLMKDINQQVIGFEKLFFLRNEGQEWFSGEVEVSVETLEEPI